MSSPHARTVLELLTAAIVSSLTEQQAALITVCAWHTPRPELDRLNQLHPGQITHGICPSCASRMTQEIA